MISFDIMKFVIIRITAIFEIIFKRIFDIIVEVIKAEIEIMFKKTFEIMFKRIFEIIIEITKIKMLIIINKAIIDIMINFLKTRLIQFC